MSFERENRSSRMYRKGFKYDRTVPQNLLIKGAFGSDCIGELIRLCAAQ